MPVSFRAFAYSVAISNAHSIHKMIDIDFSILNSKHLSLIMYSDITFSYFQNLQSMDHSYYPYCFLYANFIIAVCYMRYTIVHITIINYDNGIKVMDNSAVEKLISSEC